MITGMRRGKVMFQVIDSIKCRHLYFAWVILLFCEHFRKLQRPQKVDYQQLNFSCKDTSSICENMRFFDIIEKEKLTGLGSKPKVNKLQCKSRVGTEGMQGVYSDRECFILN